MTAITASRVEAVARHDLLPWFSIGRTTPDETRALVRRLALDVALTRRLALVEEERRETCSLLRGLEGPSDRPLRTLLAAVATSTVDRRV